MPTSDPAYVPVLWNKLKLWKPNKVLDLGVGYGKNGFLVREFMDTVTAVYPDTRWTGDLLGVEVYESYIQELQRQIYDDIIIGAMPDVLDDLANSLDEPHWDLILMTDVLEHFSEDVGRQVLDWIEGHSKHYFITTPVQTKFGKVPQYVRINPAEEHLHHYPDGFLEYWGQVQTVGNVRIVAQ